MGRKKAPKKTAAKKPPSSHSPGRRKLLKGVGIYVGDKALGGIIDRAVWFGAGVALNHSSALLTTSATTVIVATTMSAASAHASGAATVRGVGEDASNGVVEVNGQLMKACSTGPSLQQPPSGQPPYVVEEPW